MSRDASVESDTFSRSTVSIGRDIATYGLNSSVLEEKVIPFGIRQLLVE